MTQNIDKRRCRIGHCTVVREGCLCLMTQIIDKRRCRIGHCTIREMVSEYEKCQ